ncbi:MAG: hypothetical protein M3377_05675 [Actinomycetota bacterium]|nr:hypothetical protein [Actinomycetota bacterium]
MVHTSTRWLLIAATAVVVFLVVSGSSFVEMRNRLGDLAGPRDGGRAQSGSQISEAEFARAAIGTSPASLRASVGEPEGKSTNRLEGLAVECWYYGIGGTSGSYQLCFVNGKLRSKLRFDP